MHIVLVQPEIPQNTGNIARTAAVTGCPLHLIGPLGFSLDEGRIKRAGLDYWPSVNLRHYSDFSEYLTAWPDVPRYCLTTKGHALYSDVTYPDGAHLLFGRETAGLPDAIRHAYPCLRIPMRAEQRSLNLSNAVALVVYEALRQHGFIGLK